jgi:hypothetical protein
MRVAEYDTVACLTAAIARDIVRLFRGRPFVQDVAHSLLHTNCVEDGDGVFARWAQAPTGRRRTPPRPQPAGQAFTAGHCPRVASADGLISRSAAQTSRNPILQQSGDQSAPTRHSMAEGCSRNIAYLTSPTVGRVHQSAHPDRGHRSRAKLALRMRQEFDQISEDESNLLSSKFGTHISVTQQPHIRRGSRDGRTAPISSQG